MSNELSFLPAQSKAIPSLDNKITIIPVVNLPERMVMKHKESPMTTTVFSSGHTTQPDVEHSSDQTFRMLFDQNPVPMWVFDEETKRFLAANAATCKRYGFTAEQFATMTLSDLYPAEEKVRLDLYFQSDYHYSSGSTGYWRHETADGNLIWVEIFRHYVTFEGRFACLMTATDVTQQVRGWEERIAYQEAMIAAEEAARQDAQNLLGMLEDIADGFFTLDNEWRFLFVNRRIEEFMGRTRDELIGKVLWDVFPELVGSPFEEKYRSAIYQSASVTFEEKIPSLGRWFEVRAYPAPAGTSPRPMALSVILRDIHQSKESAEAQALGLQRNEKTAGQQRRLLKEMLASVTQNKLRFCLEQSELPSPLTSWCAPVSLNDSSALVTLRHKVREVGLFCGFSPDRVHDLMSSAGEGAINALVYGNTPGSTQVRIMTPPDLSRVQIWIEDHGKGISLDHILNHITNETLSRGHGFQIMLASVDAVYLMTDARGTTVVLEMYRNPEQFQMNEWEFLPTK